MKRTWYRFDVLAAKKDEPPTEADLNVYGPIGSFFFDDETVSAKDFIDDLRALPESISRIRLHVNSPGGSVFDAVTIANALHDHPAEVAVSVEGLAASAATIITSAGDSVRIAENALMMIHNPVAVVMGESGDMRKMAEALDRIRDAIITTYQWHSNLSRRKLGELMDATTWMDAEEAIENGFATELGDEMKAAAQLDERILAMLGPLPDSLGGVKSATDGIVGTPSHRERSTPLTVPAEPSGARPRRLIMAKGKTEPKAPEATDDASEVVTDEATLANLSAEARKQGFDEGKTTGLSEGAKAERERILGIEAIAMQGHEKLIAEAKADGKTTPAEVAIRQAMAEKEARAHRLDALRADGKTDVPTTPVTDAAPTVRDDSALPLEERCKAQWDRDEKIRAEYGGDYGAFLAFEKASARGLVKIHRQAS